MRWRAKAHERAVGGQVVDEARAARPRVPGEKLIEMGAGRRAVTLSRPPRGAEVDEDAPRVAEPRAAYASVASPAATSSTAIAPRPSATAIARLSAWSATSRTAAPRGGECSRSNGAATLPIDAGVQVGGQADRSGARPARRRHAGPAGRRPSALAMASAASRVGGAPALGGAARALRGPGD